VKKIGVIGATSALGNSLINFLIRENYQIFAFSRQKHISKYPDMIWLKLPCSSKEKLDTLIYAAPIRTLVSNLNLIDGFDLNRIIVISSTSKYTKEKSSSLSERELVGSINSAEIAIKDWALKRNISCIIFRPTMIYGGRNNRNIAEISRLIKKIKFFPLVGKASGLRQPIHVDDLSAACLKIIEMKIMGIREYDLSGGEIITYREMVRRVFNIMRMPVRLIIIPEHLFRFGISLLRVFPRFRYLDANMASRMNDYMSFDHSKAANDFGFKARPFQLKAEDVE
jgi:nucleoside-diphosphate-sugar epimerase